MARININEIPLAGTQERTLQQNAKLQQDLAIYRTRPFLDKFERNNLGEYYSTWGINKIIALFNFDKEGNYLPDVYQAPTEYLRMLYPIDDIMTYDRQGTLIIDREQYSPELRKLSYFIYMVDEELYEQYKEGQNFRGETAPTYMFNQHDNNGVRIFKDYFALARHLRKQRFITYCLGPRTAFYLRYFLYQIHVHTISPEYAYGEHQDATLANSVIEAIKRHLAFNSFEKLDYKVDLTIDHYQQYRLLQASKKFNIKLPEIQEFHNTTAICRYSKQSMRTSRPLRVKKNKLKKYEAANIFAYNHILLVGDYALVYVWDTRRIEQAIPIADMNLDDFSPVEHDNGMDLVCMASASEQVREACEQLRFKTAIQMRDKA